MELKANNRSPGERLVSLMAICICLYTLWTFSFGSKSERSPAHHQHAVGLYGPKGRGQVLFADGVEQVKDLPFDSGDGAAAEETSPLDDEGEEAEEFRERPKDDDEEASHSTRKVNRIIYD